MKRPLVLVGLVAFVAANVAAGLLYRAHLQTQVREAWRALAESPQEKLQARRAELEQLQRAAGDFEHRAGVSLGYALEVFDTAAVVWEEMALESSGEAGSPRLDVLVVKGLAGSPEQLSGVDKRLGPRCRSYRRDPTREGSFFFSCQVRPELFRRNE